jgi:hypothetical protein
MLEIEGRMIVVSAIRSVLLVALSMSLLIGPAGPAVAETYLDPPWNDAIAPWLLDVDAITSDDVWAVGLAGDEPLILRGGGSSWVRERVGEA